MTVSEFKDILKAKDFDKCITALSFLRPEMGLTIQQIRQSKNTARLFALLEMERQNKKLVREEMRISVIEVDYDLAGADQFFQRQKRNEVLGYPEHYPHVLQKALVEARAKVAEKKALSNTLFRVKDNAKVLAETVTKILDLGNWLDTIYAGKRLYDKEGVLSEDFLKEVNHIPDDLAAVKSELQTQMEKRAKLRAKLRNPTEGKYKNANPRAWRKNLEEVELRITALQQKKQILENLK